jgi:hypothetical protein
LPKGPSLGGTRPKTTYPRSKEYFLSPKSVFETLSGQVLHRFWSALKETPTEVKRLNVVLEDLLPTMSQAIVGVHTGLYEFTGHKYPVRTRDLVIKYKYKMMDSLEAHMPLDVKEIRI